MRLMKCAFEWDIPMSQLVETLERIGVANANPNTNLSEEQYNMLCDELSKSNPDVSPGTPEYIVDTINRLGVLTARMPTVEKLKKAYEVRTSLEEHFTELDVDTRTDAFDKVQNLLLYGNIEFKEEQEQGILKLLEEYKDLDAKHEKYGKFDYQCINASLGIFELHMEYRWKDILRLTIYHRTKNRYNDDVQHPIFPKVDDIKHLLCGRMRFVRGNYEIDTLPETWIKDVEHVLSNLKRNKNLLAHVFDDNTLRFPDGTMKVRRKMWKCHGILKDIKQESAQTIIQGIKKGNQPEYNSKPWLFGGNGTYVGYEEKYYVLKFKVLHPREELFCSQNDEVEIEDFIRNYYLPKLGRERMSANLLDSMLKTIRNSKIELYTRDFDDEGAVSITACYLPLGFNSWNEYLKTIL